MARKKMYKIKGVVVDTRNGQGIPGLRIEAWDKDQTYDDLVASASSDERGNFSMTFDESRFRELYPEQEPDLYFKVFLGNKLVCSTEDTVMWNVKAGETEIVIEVDLESKDTGDHPTYSVSGYIRTTQNIPVSNIIVEAFDKKVGEETFLGKNESNEEGYYHIDYTEKIEKDLKGMQVDLYVQCYEKSDKEKKILVKSDLLINAPQQATINLTVPKEVRRAPSEFEKLADKINELISDKNIESLNDDDFDYMAARLKLNIKNIKRYVHSLNLEQQANEYKIKPQIPADIFYALISDDDLPTMKSIVSRNKSALLQAIREAVNKEMIPPINEKRIEHFVNALRDIAVAIATAKSSDKNIFSIRNLIDLNKDIPKDIKNRFIIDYTQNEEGDSRFLEKIKTSSVFGEHFKSIHDLFTLTELTQKNLPLMRKLYRKNKSIDEFAKWETKDWEEYLHKNDFPLPVDEDGQKLTKNQYARELAQAFKKYFPMVDLINGLEKSKVLNTKPSNDLKDFFSNHADFDIGKTPIKRYLKQNKIDEQNVPIQELQHLQLAHALAPSENHNECVAALMEFEIEKDSYQPPQPEISKGKKRGKDKNHEEAASLEALQRVIRKIWEHNSDQTESPKTKSSIDEETQKTYVTAQKIKADSALKIASINKADFISKWQEIRQKDGQSDLVFLLKEAEAIHNRAKYQSFMFAVNAWNIAAPLSSVTPAFVSNTYSNIMKSVQSQDKSKSDDETGQTIANLTTLFGNQHYCECQHCQSIYSPAAYLVQLFDALSYKAKCRLFARRPDIQFLHLNCENTNTKLPYIDLVIEQLERILFDSDGLGLFDPSWANLQTTLTENELALRSEHEFSISYFLLSLTPYPISIPWDKWFEEARLYLDYMELPLYRLVEIFTRPLKPLETGAAFDYHRNRKQQLNSEQCVRALLGLPVPLYDLISKPLTGDDPPETLIFNLEDLNAFFGFASNEFPIERNLIDFMGKLGFWQKNEEGKSGKEDFKLFRRIQGSRYIQDSEGSSDIDIAFEKDHPCDPEHAEIRYFNQNTIIRILKFEHLRRALGWSPDELSQTVMTFSGNLRQQAVQNTITSGIDSVVKLTLKEMIIIVPSLPLSFENYRNLRSRITKLILESIAKAIKKSVLTHIFNLVYLLDEKAVKSIPVLIQFNAREFINNLLAILPKEIEKIFNLKIQSEITRTINHLIAEHINKPLGYKITNELIHLQTEAISENLLRHISHLVRIQERKSGLTVTELLSWWGPIETNADMRIIPPSYEGEEKEDERISLYEKVFLDKSLYSKRSENPEDNLEWNYFKLNSRSTELEYLENPDNVTNPEKILEHKAIVCAALKLSDKDLLELSDFVAKAYFDTSGESLELNLSNLSALYRVVSLTCYLDVTIHEFVLLHQFMGKEIDPFKWMQDSNPIETDTAIIFIECVEKIKRSPFEIRDLVYLWQHYTESDEELVYVNKRLENYLLELGKRFKEVQEEDNIPVQNDSLSIDAIEKTLEQIGLHKNNISKIVNIIRHDYSNDQNASEFVARTYRFLSPEAREELIDLLIINRHAEFPGKLDIYELTDGCIENLEKEEIADDVLRKIKDIKAWHPNREYVGEKSFLTSLMLIGQLTPEQVTQYKSLILKHADRSLRKIANYLTPAVKMVVFLSQEFANFFGIPQEVARKLLSVVLNGSENNNALLQDFADWGSSINDAKIHSHLLRLDKIASIVNKWDLTAEEIEYLQGPNINDPGLFDWNRIPIIENTEPVYTEWSTLAEYVDARNRYSLNKGDIIELFINAHDPDSKTVVVLEKLAALLNIEMSEIKLIVQYLGYVDNNSNPKLQHNCLRNAKSLKPVIDIAETLKRAGRSFSVVKKWITGDDKGENNALILDASFISNHDQLLKYKKEVVEEIRNSVKASCSENQWQEVARRFQDQMRVLQRDKLLDWIIACYIGYGADGDIIRFNGPEEAYDYLLIDPQMNPCMDTTRLKLAISSVQLFIHRILMGLEGEELKNENETSALAEEWKWKKNYRVWEAHQKVFLYPENWIEPELRDNKTPFFEEFESELAQSEIDEKSIEKAFKNYLRKVDEVGHLEVASFKEGIQTTEPFTITRDDGSEMIFNFSTYDGLHVIGRTREKPHTYYYRKRDNNDIWLPWERIDLDIDSEVVLLTIYNGLPYIFWPTIKERVQKLGQDNPDDENNDKNNYRPVFEIMFNWSSYQDGRWLPKKKNDEPAVLMYEWKYQEFFEKPEQYILYDIQYDSNDSNKIEIGISMPADNRTTIKRYTWNNDKLSEIFENVYKLPSEIDWDFIIGSGLGPLFTSDSADLITTNVERLITAAEKELKQALFSHSYDREVLTISILTNILNKYFQCTEGSGPLSMWLKDFPSSWSNKDGGTGLHEDDIALIDSAFSELAELSNITTKLNVYDYHYHSLNIQSNQMSQIKLIKFAFIEFSGYKLKSKTKNASGLSLITYPNNAKIDKDPARFYITSHSNFNPLNIESYNYNYTNYENYYLLLSRYYLFNYEQLYYHDIYECYFLNKQQQENSYSYERFYHPWTYDYNTIIHNNVEKASERFDNLLHIARQNEGKDLPTTLGDFEIQDDQVDDADKKLSFDFNKAFGIYNWEIFFHMPFTIAVRLSQQKKFAEAQQWFHYIFNPLASLSLNDGGVYDKASQYWNFLPLHKLGQPETQIDQLKLFSFSGDYEKYQEIMDDIQTTTSELAKDPFQPHRVARLYRKSAYQKAVVIKYLNNLIDWGDYLFTQDTIESINEATHLYILAAKILGPRPRLVPKPTKQIEDEVSTLLSAAAHSESIVQAETAFQMTAEHSPAIDYERLSGELDLISSLQWFQGLPPEADSDEEPPSTINEQPLFCVPHNEKLLSYWDKVANRLFKLRNCMNIEGQIRELPIYEPPIDPALLVRGQALGIDISELLSDLYTPRPPYRFRVMLQKAYEFCGDVQKLGGALLSALEKKDAEELSLLRSRHEQALLKLTKNIKKQQIKELKENLKSTQTSLEMAEARFEYYSSRKFENQNEKAQVNKLNIATGFNIASQVVSVTAAAAYGFPEITPKPDGPPDVQFGGANVGHAADSMSKFLNLIGNIYSHEANLHSIQGSREQRMDDWKFQASNSQKEIKQIKKQILAAEIRLNIAERELENHEKQQEQAEEIKAFMESKFTNKQLYHWMISQISGIYFQTYKMALDLAKTAQKCYRYEKGEDSAVFISAAYWDNLKKGLLSGEKIQFDLRRMESEYLRKNKRELEVTKNISLKWLDPIQLDELRYNGKCTFELPELLFDLDHPGHYFRRIKSLSISIPCVVGPYSGINCTLRLVESKTRKESDTSADGLKPDPSNIDKISLSSGQNDSGLFELNHNDERYLPFELRGVVSKWELEFPSTFEQFDRSTIADIIINMRYTALMGDKKDVVNAAIVDTCNSFREVVSGQPTGMAQRLDIRREFPDLWHKFSKTQNENGDNELTLDLTKELFPYLIRSLGINVTHLSFFCELKKSPEQTPEIHWDVEKGGPLSVVSEAPEGRYYFKLVNQDIGTQLGISDTPISIKFTCDSKKGEFKELILVLHYECK